MLISIAVVWALTAAAVFMLLLQWTAAEPLTMPGGGKPALVLTAALWPILMTVVIVAIVWTKIRKLL